MNCIKAQKKINTTWIFSIAITIIFCLILTILYRNQTIIEPYTPSDLLPHIKAGLSENSSYSLTYLILGFLWKLPRYHSVIISLFLTSLNILSIIFTYILFKIHLKNIHAEYLYVAALVCNIYMPIHMPLLNSSPYLGMFCFNLYHNSTYQTMKPFAVLSIIIFIKLFNKYYDKTISILEWISFASCLFITTWFKPSFMFGFAPCMLVVMIIDFIKRKGKNILNYIIFGTTTFPAILLMLWQKTQLFDQQNGLEFCFFKVWMLNTKNPLICLILSILFPLVVLIFSYKDLLVDKIYQFGWLFAVVNISIFAFLCESGGRFADGNLGWGAQIAVGILFITSMYKFLYKIKNISKFKVVITSGILGMHIICGINYVLNYTFMNYYS